MKKLSVELICDWCKQSFYVRPYREKTARFCSRQCGGSWHATTRLVPMPKPWLVGNKHAIGHTPTNAFIPGHVTWNKNLKGIHLSPTSEFKTGTRPATWVAIGTERTRADKNGQLRTFIKTAEPNTWRPRAHVVWEALNGDIPNGYIIHHENRDTLDDTIENLFMITRSQHLIEHRLEHTEQRINGIKRSWAQRKKNKTIK